MIKILKTKNKYLFHYIAENIRRTFNTNPRVINKISKKEFNNSIIFVTNLKINQEKKIFEIATKSKFKIIYFGGFSEFFSKKFEFKNIDLKKNFNKIRPASRGKISTSNFKISYSTKTNLAPKITERYLYRYDFSNEWNNNGYGEIDLQEKNIWSIKSLILCKKQNNIGTINIQKNLLHLSRYIRFIKVNYYL